MIETDEHLADDAGAAPSDAGSTKASSPTWMRIALVLAFLVAALPIVAGAATRIHDGWQPTSDEGIVARLSADVFSGHSPQVGMRTTVSDLDTPRADPHHLGPIQFWFLAPAAEIAHGSAAGIVVTTAIVHLLALAGIAWFVCRRRGAGWAAVALVILTFCMGGLGYDVMSSIWTPNFPLLWLAFFFVLAWSAASGDALAVPFAVVAASFVVQGHYEFAVILVTCGIIGAVGLVLSARAAGPDGPGVKRPLIASLFVALACWALPIGDQILHDPGNMVLVWRGINEDNVVFGWAFAARFVARSLSLVPWWARRQPRFDDYARLGNSLSIWEWISSLAFVALMIALTVWSWRKHPVIRWALLVGAVGVVASTYTISQLPVQFVAPTPYRSVYVRFTGWFVWFAFLLAAVTYLREQAAVRRVVDRVSLRPLAAAGAVVLAAVLVFAALSGVRRSPSYMRFDDDNKEIQALSEQTRARIGDGPVVFIDNAATGVISPGPGVMWNLVRHGVDVRVPRSDHYLGREHPGTKTMPRLIVQIAPSADGPKGDLVEVAHYNPTTAAARRARDRLRAETIALLERDGLPEVNERGLRQLARDPDSQGGEAVDDLLNGNFSIRELVERKTLAILAFAGFVDPNAPFVKPLGAFQNLNTKLRQSEYAVYVDPWALPGQEDTGP